MDTMDTISLAKLLYRYSTEDVNSLWQYYVSFCTLLFNHFGCRNFK